MTYAGTYRGVEFSVRCLNAVWTYTRTRASAYTRRATIAPGTPLFRRVHPRGGIGGRITAGGVNRAIKFAIKRY